MYSMANETLLLQAWHRNFGDSAVSARHVIASLFDGIASGSTKSIELFDAIVTLCPDFANKPQPKVISRWLLANENLFFPFNDDNRARFTAEHKPGLGIHWLIILDKNRTPKHSGVCDCHECWTTVNTSAA